MPLPMAHGTAAEVAAKWAKNAQAAQSEYTAGVNRVTQAPGEKAAQAANVWQARVSDPQVLEKFKRKVSAVSLDQWKNAAANYGASRYSQGVASKQEKFAQAMQPLLQYIDNAKQQVHAMPNVTFEDRLQRSRMMQVLMHRYQGTA